MVRTGGCLFLNVPMAIVVIRGTCGSFVSMYFFGRFSPKEAAKSANDQIDKFPVMADAKCCYVNSDALLINHRCLRSYSSV